ncbi:MAG: radical SAM protein [Proteobacteria bacterium]|nr:radical SAM protein [Pseudomonadota bacterium]MBU4357022.1 radical SAM protein [Pseudomonadota bacterium]MBU4449404.1 radical SAM protein [Pseudomonadota bacterium]MCG2772960.1 radical SAM protein [Desulfobacterales bacterium]
MPKRPDSRDMTYQGFEQGPIRPPSEAHSLLLRVTRNCPWNHCTFCPVYKGARFSVRPVAHILRDIDAVYEAAQQLREGPREPALTRPAGGDPRAWSAARNWERYGRGQVFLQDANSLVVDPGDLTAILGHLKARFPEVTRITSYARSSTIANLDAGALADLRDAGLSRIHIGMESGANEVLKMVRKGATQRLHIRAGLKVKAAGMELSEYYMPGLGGRRWLEANAVETAAALNQINPDFIRLRTLAIPTQIPLYEDFTAGRFHKATDVETARELLLFLESLSGITSAIRSDHILNLLPEVDGQLPQDQTRLMEIVGAFLKLEPELQFIYRVGRRLGLLSGLGDLADPGKIARVEGVCREYGLRPDDVDAVTDDLMRRFI